MRHRIAAMSLVLLVLIAGGVTIAMAGSDSANAPITAPKAVAFIHAVSLQPTDLPGSAPYVGEPGSPPEAAEFLSLLHCGHRGKPRGRPVAAERSVIADWYRDWIGEVVASVVIVMPSEALAKAEIATLASRSGRVCMEREFRSSQLGSGRPGGPVYATSITFPPVARVLGREALVLHLLARLRRSHRVSPLRRRLRSSPPAKFLYEIDAIFRVGGADIVFITESEHRRFPPATERRLLTLLYERAKAHKLS